MDYSEFDPHSMAAAVAQNRRLLGLLPQQTDSVIMVAEPKRNAVIIDFFKDGEKTIRTVRIECKDIDMRSALEAEGRRILELNQ